MNPMDFFLSLDSFGESIELSYRGKKRFSTVCGSIISTFLYVTFFAYTVEQGLIFLKKEDITISQYEVVDLEGALEEIHMSDQLGGFTLRLTRNGQNVDLNDIDLTDGQISARYIVYEENDISNEVEL